MERLNRLELAVAIQMAIARGNLAALAAETEAASALLSTREERRAWERARMRVVFAQGQNYKPARRRRG